MPALADCVGSGRTATVQFADGRRPVGPTPVRSRTVRMGSRGTQLNSARTSGRGWERLSAVVGFALLATVRTWSRTSGEGILRSGLGRGLVLVSGEALPSGLASDVKNSADFCPCSPVCPEELHLLSYPRLGALSVCREDGQLLQEVLDRPAWRAYPLAMAAARECRASS